jgi:hypothetical protein
VPRPTVANRLTQATRKRPPRQISQPPSDQRAHGRRHRHARSAG